LLETGIVGGMAHITGGGLTENLPRTLPDGCGVEVDRSAWCVPPLFDFIRQRGHIATDEMFRTFNMGIGLAIVCRRSDVDLARKLLESVGEVDAALIGRVIKGAGVTYTEGRE
jgi:phosphoribosylaminoimidazole (AIR) synthetase